jgi:uncharacterized protein (TIGR02145 family)
MRETEKVGRRIPTDEEFEWLNKENFGKIIYTGYRDTEDSFDELGSYSSFWSSSESGTSSVWNRYLRLFNSTVKRSPDNRDSGLSVRCVKE